MAIAIFDFDGTLVYMPSSLVWSKKMPLLKKLMFPFLYIFEKITGKSLYQKKAFEWMVGLDIRSTLIDMAKLPAVPKGLKYFKELSERGYRMIVMSYSPGVVIQPWLDYHGLNAEVICPDFDVYDGVVQNISTDEITQIYMQQPKYAKTDIIKMLNVLPEVSVGDNPKRDVLCSNYKPIQELQPKYKTKLSQVLSNLNKIF
ncbi:MAG: haloacid dehalogenase-like hydrolase [Candidatus Altiarchaeota archaeon]|nr:haloacid dehalogenase-like hydrolase [Candidatus Altiarchaeota archaeon]